MCIALWHVCAVHETVVDHWTVVRYRTVWTCTIIHPCGGNCGVSGKAVLDPVPPHVYWATHAQNATAPDPTLKPTMHKATSSKLENSQST